MLHTPYHNERVNASSSCCQSTFIDDYEEEEEEQGDLQVGNYAEEELCTNIQTQTSPKWWEVVAEKKDPRTKKIASKKGFTPVATTMRWRRRPPPSPSKKPTQSHNDAWRPTLDGMMRGIMAGKSTKLDHLADAASLSGVQISNSERKNKNFSLAIVKDSNYFDSLDQLRRRQQRAWEEEYTILPSPSLFSSNPQLDGPIRCRLINWLIEIAMHFRLHRETFHLALHYFDRFLSVVQEWPRSGLQVLAIAAIHVACKLEEIYPPKLKDVVALCDGTCTSADIHQAELQILFMNEWKLWVPTPYYWLGLYLEMLRVEVEAGRLMDSVLSMRTFALTYLDMAMHTGSYLMFPYSLLVAAILALRFIDQTPNFMDSGIVTDELKRRNDRRWLSIVDQTLTSLSVSSPSSESSHPSISTFSTSPMTILGNITGYRHSDLTHCIRWLDESFSHEEGYYVFFDAEDQYTAEEAEKVNKSNFRIMLRLTERIRSGAI